MVSSIVEKLNPTRVKLTITVTPEDLKPSLDHAYKHIAEQVSIPGFRKGAVPAPIIDQRVGRAEVLNHAVNEGLDSFYQAALAEHDLRPLSRPEADITEWPQISDFSGNLLVVVEVEVRPEFELPKFDQLKIAVSDVEASEEEVEAELDYLRSRFGNQVVADRPAKTGDIVQLNLVAKIEGNTVDSAEDVSYELGSGELLEGIDEALDSLTAGESTTFESTLLGGEHEGKTAEVSVELLSVKERQLPEADDDFAQIASQFDTIAELKADLKEQVLASKKMSQFTDARTKLVDALIEATELPVSEKAIEDEVHRHLEQENRLEDEEHRKEVTESSTKQLKQQLILDKVVDDKEIKVGQDDLSRYVVQAASQYNLDPNEFIKIVSEQGQLPAIVADLARSKAITAILADLEIKTESGKAVDFSEFVNVDPGADLPTADDHAGHDHEGHDH